MQKKFDSDATHGKKLLRLFQKLLIDGRKHYLRNLCQWLNCSPQTVLRLIGEIEEVVGASLESGFEGRRRWYQMKSSSRNRLGLDYEELRYLAICRDLAEPFLPGQIKARLDQSIFNFSVLMADRDFTRAEKARGRIGYCAKGWIDYSSYFGFLDILAKAMAEKRICVLRYQALGKTQAKTHRLAPNRIVGMHNALYVLGALVSEDMESMIKLGNFAIHRIKKLELTGYTWDFEMPDEDLDLFGLPWHQEKLFRIRFTSQRAAQYVAERVWSGKQKIHPQPDGGIILEMASASEPEVLAWVRSFGDDAELLSEEHEEDEEREEESLE